MWQYDTLDKFGTASRGRSQHRPRNDASLFGGDYPFIQTGDVKKSDLYITEFEQTYNEKGLAQSKLWDEGTLCITIAANIADTGILGIKACFPDSIIGFIPNEKCDIKFLKYSFDILQTYCKQISRGTTQDNLSWQKLSRIKFPNPPLPTQQKIASILSAYDKLIQNYKKQIEALQTAASELYKEWFVRFRFPGYQTTRFENGIPEGWKVEKLGTLANISTGKCNREDAEADGIYPLFDRSQEIKKSNEWIKDCEAIIVPGEGTSFIPRYYKGKFNLHQRCYCVEPKYPDFGKFLFYVLMLNRKYFLSVATGATVPSLRYNNFASMKFVLLEMSLCNNFNKIVDDIFAKIDNLNKQITNLTQQRDLLLPRLMSGKLEVE